MKKIKFNSAALIMACVFSLLAILGTVFSIRSIVSKADSPLPPSPTPVSLVSSLDNFEISLTVSDSIHSVEANTFIGRFSDNDGFGVNVQTDITLTDSLGNSCDMWYSIGQDNLFFRLFFDSTDGFALIRMTYSGLPIYLSETEYNRLFLTRSFLLTESVASSENNSFYSFVANFEKFDFTDKGESFSEIITLENNSFSSVSGLNRLSFYSWDYLNDLGLVRNGIVFLTYYDFWVSVPVSSTVNTVSLNIPIDIDYSVASEWSNTIYENYSIYSEDVIIYQKIPVDDIGFGVIFDGINAFLNTEFIPGFRLWYFLLFGLGTSLLFFFLKTFLGG